MTAAAPPVQVRSGAVVVEPHGAHHRGEHRAVLLALDREHVRGGTAFADVEHVEGALGDLGEHRELDRAIGLDDRGQTVLPIDQHPVDVERDPLMGDQPLVAAHRLSERTDHRPRQGTVGRVRLQPLRRPRRRDRLHPAAHLSGTP